jgi:hypothetical protein
MSIVLFGFGICAPLEDLSGACSLPNEMFTPLNAKPISSGFSWKQVKRI